MDYLRTLDYGISSFLKQGDPRVKTWFLMQTPFPGWVLIAVYIYFVKIAGPKWMKNRPAFELRKLMVGYNFTMVFINFYIFYMIGKYGWFNNYSLRCQPVDFSNSYEAITMAQTGWLFYVTKFVEFTDTIFFVLRKKERHISALHVIHHSIVPFSLWFGIKFAPGGYNAFFPFINSFVHVIMYSYYGLAALGPQFQKYLKWKKLMTYIQMSQFVLVFLYAVQLMCLGGCEVSINFLILNIFHALLFLILFYNFFRKAYGHAFHNKAATSETKLSKSSGSTCNRFDGKGTDSNRGYDAQDLSIQDMKKEIYLKRSNKLAKIEPLLKFDPHNTAEIPILLPGSDFSPSSLDISKFTYHANGLAVGQSMNYVLRSRFPSQ